MKNCIFCNERKIEIKSNMLCKRCDYLLIKKPGYVDGINASSDICQMCHVSYSDPYSKYALCKKCKLKSPHILSQYIRSDEHRYLMFLDKLSKKYGDEFFENMDSLKQNPYTTLDWVAQQHGVTREYVRQLFHKIYGESYTATLHKNIALKKGGAINICDKDIRNYYAKCDLFGDTPTPYKQIEMLFLKKAESLGMSVTQKCTRKVDFDVNGFAVDVKHCGKPFIPPKGRTPSHRFSFSFWQSAMCDFLACYHSTEKCFFIIPMPEIVENRRSEVKKDGNLISIPDSIVSYRTARNRWWKYKNAWGLLNR